MYKNILLLLAVVGLASCSRAADGAAPESADQASAPARVGFYGDALPEGAVARMGTQRLTMPLMRQARLSDDKNYVLLFGSHGQRGVLKVADVKTGAWLTGREHTAGIVDARFLRYSDQILLLTRSHAYLWRWQENEPPQELMNIRNDRGEERFAPVGLTRTGRVVVANEEEFRILNPFTQSYDRQIALETERPIHRLCYSSDGEWLAVWNAKSLYLVNLSTGKVSPLVESGTFGTLVAAFSPDGDMLAASSYDFDRNIRLWDLATLEELDPLPVERANFRGFAFMPDGHLAIASTSGRIVILDVTSGEKLREINVGRNITNMVFSSDGQLGVFLYFGANFRGAVYLWDIVDNRPVHDFENDPVRFKKVAFSSNGQVMLTGQGASLLAWRAQSGEFLYRLKQSVDEGGHGPSTYAISPTDGALVTAQGTRAAFRDPITGDKTGRHIDYEGYVGSLAFSPDGDRLAGLIRGRTVAPDGKITVAGSLILVVQNSDSGEELLRISDLPKQAIGCKFSADGKWILIQNRMIKGPAWVYSSSSGELAKTIQGRAFVWSPAGAILATYEPYSIRLWNIETDEVVGEFPQRGGPSHHLFRDMAFSPDGRLLAVDDPDPWDDIRFRIYDVATGQIVHRGSGHESRVTALAFSRDGRFLATGSDDATVLVWELPEAVTAGEPVPDEMIPVRLPDSRRAHHVVWSADGKYVAAGGIADDFQLWDASSWELIRQIEGKGRYGYSVAFTADSRHVVLYDNTTYRRQYLDVQTGLPATDAAPREQEPVASTRPSDRRRFFTGSGRGVAISPDGKMAVTGGRAAEAFAIANPPGGHGEAGGVYLWDAETGEVLTCLTREGGSSITCLLFSPDGRHVLASNSDGKLRIWSVETGRQLHSLEKGDGNVTVIAISPDSRRVLFGGKGRALHLLDIQTGREVALPQFDEIDGGLLNVMFSPDGRYVVYSDVSGIWRRRLPE